MDAAMQGFASTLSHLKRLKPSKYHILFYSFTCFLLLCLFLFVLNYEALAVKEVRHILQTDISRLNSLVKTEDIAFSELNKNTQINSLAKLSQSEIAMNQFDVSFQKETNRRLNSISTNTNYLYLFILLTALVVLTCYISIYRLVTRLYKIKISEKSLAELLYFNQLNKMDTSEITPVKNDTPLVMIPSLEELQYALLTEQFQLYYQPIVKAENGEMVGMEALIRWQHPVHGFISPDVFIPICEENNFIIPLGAWACDTACRQLKIWHKKGYQHLYVSVNLSTVQLHDPRLITIITEALQAWQLPANFLRLEITESQIMRDIKISMKVLAELRKLGVQLSLDDFGTGYSSLTYLKQFSFSYLKIDKSFIRDISSNITSVGIVEAIIKLGHSLGLLVIAEGIENEEQAKILNKMHCDYLQGYYFNKPLSVADFTNQLIKNNSLQISPEVKKSYYFKILTTDEKNMATHLISHYFCNNGPITNHLQLTPDIIKPYITLIIKQAIKQGTSLVAIHDNNVIACAIVLDLAEPLQFGEIHDERLLLVQHFMRKCNANFFDENSLQKNHIANLLISAFDDEHIDNNLITAMNLKALDLARSKNYDFMFCAFTHINNEKATLPHLLNNKLRLRSLPYKDFFFQGTYPFEQLDGSVNAYIWELHEDAKLNYQIKDAM